MKKRLLTAAMVSVALASCVTDESLTDVGKQDGEIKFVAANYVAQTRGEHGEGAFSNDDFSVYAWEQGTDATNYMVNVQMVTKEATDAGGNTTQYWGTQNGLTYYWPNNTYLDFTAVSPYNAVGNYINVTRTSGATTIEFEFTETNKNPKNVNLMYADYVTQKYDYDVASNPYVALLFRHVLAKLNVVLNQVNPEDYEENVFSYEVKVKNLSISGIRNQGSLTVDNTYVNNAKTDNGAVWNNAVGNDTWTIISNNDGVSLMSNTAWDEEDPDATVTATPQPYNSNTNYYVMPQTIVESQDAILGNDGSVTTPAVTGQQMHVTYQVITTFTDGRVDANRVFERTIDLSDISEVTAWQTNKNITYTINISPATLVPITFTVSEENWCPDVEGEKDVD